MNRKAPALAWLPLVLLGALPPAQAQQVDPFEAIVSSPDGADTPLNDLAIPLKNPTESELRQYLEAFRSINLSAAMRVDDGRTPTRVGVPVGNVTLGPFSVPRGTEIALRAGFEKRGNEPEAVLRTLEMNPSNPMALGPLRFNRMTLDDKGVMHFHLNMRLMGVDFWPQELTIEKVYRDAEGALVFKTGGTGLAGKFVPDLRIKRDGTVQRWSRGYWLFGWRGAKWKDVEVDGTVMKLDSSLPIDRWPPRATDLLNWLPQPGTTGTPAPSSTTSDLRPILDAIPIRDLALRFEARADRRRIELSGDRGHVTLSDHELRFTASGAFDGRTYRTDTARPNDYLATATIEGEVHDPALGRATIDRTAVRLEGTHRETLPFEDPSGTTLDATLRVRAEAALSNVRAELPEGSYLVVPGTVRGELNGGGAITLRPLAATADERTELRLDRDTRYRFEVDGPVELGELGRAIPGTTVPTLRVVAADDPTTPDRDESRDPTLHAEGTAGTRMGFVFTKTELHVDGVTETGGMVSVLDGNDPAGRPLFRTTLREGARAHLYAYTFAGIREDTLEGGGVRATADLRLSGSGSGTTVDVGGVRADLPGTSEVEARVAGNVRYGTRNGAELSVRRAAAATRATLTGSDGSVELGLPGGPTLRSGVGEGTSFSMSTGSLTRSDVRGAELETEGYARGERGARLEAHLVLTAGSVAHRDLALALEGRVTVDLTAAIGFRIDPNALRTTQPAGAPPASPLRGNVDVDLALAVDFAPGSAFHLRGAGVREARLAFGGQTRFTFHTGVTVDAATGTPTLRRLHGIDVSITADAIDLRALLEPLGAVVASASRTTVRIRDASVDFLPEGIRLTHNGVTVELGAGTILFGR